MSSLILKNLVKKFGDLTIINDVDLSIKSGEFIVFVGPSGCGKSTLLRIISGLESVSSGEIHIDGKEVTYSKPSERNISMVFQSYALYPHMTVYENIAFGLKLENTDKKQLDEKVKSVANILNLNEYINRLPKELSGGQRQRVAIGRSMVREPRIFLFDEPLSNLDASLRIKTRIEIAQMHKELTSTMIYVTHDQVEAMTLADRLVILNGGKIEQFDTPENVYENPDNIFVASFIGSPSMNFIDVEIQKDDKKNNLYIILKNSTGDDNIIYLDDIYKDVDKYIGQTVIAGIRPEHMQNGFRDQNIYNGLQDLNTSVSYREFIGADAFLYFKLNNTNVVSRISPRGFKDIGKNIVLKVWAKKIFFFDKETKNRIY